MKSPFAIDDFLQNYILSALWEDIEKFQDAYKLPAWFRELTDGARDRMVADCERFRAQHGHLWTESQAADAGLSFWFSRNLRVGGFAEVDWGEVGPRLHKAAREFGPFHLAVDKAGRVIVAPESGAEPCLAS